MAIPRMSRPGTGESRHLGGRGAQARLLAGIALAGLVFGGANAQAPAASPAQAAPAVQAASIPAASPTAIDILLEQAGFWRSRGRLQQVVDSLNRVFAVDPNNVEAIAMLAQVQVDQSDYEGARTTVTKLKKVNPNDPRIANVEQIINMTAAERDQLTDARRLAMDGHGAEALAIYQQLFKGNAPPAGIATEYFQVLSGTEGGFEKARDGLEKRVTEVPQDLQAQLALAQLQTYREDTRADGIARLQDLAVKPGMKELADQSLRQVLQWEPDSADSVPDLEAFLARNPGDPVITKKLQAAQNNASVTVDEGAVNRLAGYTALQAGKPDDAEAKFKRALEINPKDADALGGMGLALVKLKRIEEARKFLAQAVEGEPLWQDAYNKLPPVGAKTTEWTARDAAALTGQYRQVQDLTAAGRYAEAEQLLTKLMGSHGNWGTYSQLADIQARAGKLAEAEASYRKAMAMSPKSAAPIIGLAGLLERSGRAQESEALLNSIDGGAGAEALAQLRAAKLRKEANASGNLKARTDLLRTALGLTPTDPWLRLELARTLAQQNLHAEAAQVMGSMGMGAKATAGEIQAAAFFAQDHDDLASASALIDRLPPASRTPEMRALQDRAALQVQIARSIDRTNRGLTRNRLLSLAAMPDPTGVRVAEIAKQFINLGDKLSAREAVRLGLRATGVPTPAQRLAYGNALLAAGFEDNARLIATPINPAALPSSDQASFNGLQDNIAIKESDRLVAQEDFASAYDSLAPRLAIQPNGLDLNLALARIYQAGHRANEALNLFEQVLRQRPNDLDVRRAAVGAALQAGAFSHAEKLAAEAMRTAPQDPRSFIMAADVARARGRLGTALDYLARARELRAQQLYPPPMGAPLGEYRAQVQSAPLQGTPLPKSGM